MLRRKGINGGREKNGGKREGKKKIGTRIEEAKNSDVCEEKKG